MIIAISPTVQRKSIVLGSFTLRLMPRLAAKAATAKAMTADLTRMIIHTSTCTDVHFTKTFIDPKQMLPKIIHRTAARGESEEISLSDILHKAPSAL
tara:strand:+ start:272 stop:562 length:291 start_codon:yes stop_codon:yes gene_type:complete